MNCRRHPIRVSVRQAPRSLIRDVARAARWPPGCLARGSKQAADRSFSAVRRAESEPERCRYRQCRYRAIRAARGHSHRQAATDDRRLPRRFRQNRNSNSARLRRCGRDRRGAGVRADLDHRVRCAVRRCLHPRGQHCQPPDRAAERMAVEAAHCDWDAVVASGAATRLASPSIVRAAWLDREACGPVAADRDAPHPAAAGLYFPDADDRDCDRPGRHDCRGRDVHRRGYGGIPDGRGAARRAAVAALVQQRARRLAQCLLRRRRSARALRECRSVRRASPLPRRQPAS